MKRKRGNMHGRGRWAHSIVCSRGAKGSPRCHAGCMYDAMYFHNTSCRTTLVSMNMFQGLQKTLDASTVAVGEHKLTQRQAKVDHGHPKIPKKTNQKIVVRKHRLISSAWHLSFVEIDAASATRCHNNQKQRAQLEGRNTVRHNLL